MMSWVPRLLLDRWTELCAQHHARQQRKPGYDLSKQTLAFRALMGRFAKTHFGREHNLTATTSYAQFQSTVAPRLYADIAPYIARVAAGEADVLAPGTCWLMIETAGTTGPGPKTLPVNEAQLAHGRQAWLHALYLYAQRVGRTRIFRGHHLLAGERPKIRETPAHYRTTLARLVSLFLGRRTATTDPLGDAPVKPGEIPADICLLAGTPGTLEALSRQLPAPAPGSKLAPLAAALPKLECLAILAAQSQLFSEELRRLAGPTTRTHEIYLAAEALIAAEDHAVKSSLRLLTDTGVFFEFLPLLDFHPSTLAHAGPRCVPLSQVRSGIDYVILLTTPGGLCRYVLGDVVRFASVTPPSLANVSRLHSHLNLCGEQVSERDVVDALVTVCQDNNWQPVNLHVAPYQQRIAAGQMLACHEWWIELHTHSIKTPTANVISPALDAVLARRNPVYAEKRARQQLGPPWIRLVMPGIFKQWAQQQEPVLDPCKIPHCRSDRQIADQLAMLAGFHAATVPKFRAGDGPRT